MANQFRPATFAVDKPTQSASRIASLLREIAAEKAIEAADRSAQASIDAENRLSECGYPPLDRIDCEAKDGVLYLSGRVPSFYLKQLAQTFVRDVPGITVVVNNLLVNNE